MKSPISEPVSITDQYLYGVNVRLEILIEQLSSIISHISATQDVPIEEAKTETPIRTRKKG